MIMARNKNGKPEWMYGLDQEQIEFYQRLEPEQAMCRGGRRHHFHMQDLIAGRNLPHGINLVPVRGGVYQLTDHCERGCGRWIRYETLPGGAIDWDSARYGGGGPNYRAKGLGLTAGDDKLFMHWLADQAMIDRIKRIRKLPKAAQA
jgi:hypothetical protein